MNLKELDDIINGCAAQKRKSQEELYNLFAEEMYGVCVYYSGNRTEAEDILHEGFIKVFRNISQFSHKGSFAGWIRRIMVNTALEKYRKQSHLMVVSDDFSFNEDIEPEGPDDFMTTQELVQMVSELSPRYRMVFNLYAVEGYSHKEISDIMGISEGTSKSNLARARYILQEKVKKYYFSQQIRQQNDPRG